MVSQPPQVRQHLLIHGCSHSHSKVKQMFCHLFYSKQLPPALLFTPLFFEIIIS